MHKLYFAYGSNMNPHQMIRRCPNSRPIAKATLGGFRLAINSRGVATIVCDEDSKVSGVVWKISPIDEMRLDRFEGVKIGAYFKREISILFGNKRRAKALVYVDKVSDVGIPREGYLEKIIRGARYFRLDKKYISNLERLAYA